MLAQLIPRCAVLVLVRLAGCYPCCAASRGERCLMWMYGQSACRTRLLVVERYVSSLGAFPVAWLLIRDASRYSCREGAYDSANKSQDPLFIAPHLPTSTTTTHHYVRSSTTTHTPLYPKQYTFPAETIHLPARHFTFVPDRAAH